MALAELLQLSKDRQFKKAEISEERLLESLDGVRDMIAYYREYPDVFVDDIKGPDCTFKFRFTQRIFLRAVMRYKYTYFVFPRGGLKSSPVFLLIAGKTFYKVNQQGRCFN